MKPAHTSVFYRVNQYLKQNSIGLVTLGFLLIMGLATGISIIQIHYPFLAAYELASLPSVLNSGSGEYIMYTLISILTHCVFFGMLLLSSRWGPFCIFIPISVFIRGLIIGVAMRSVLMMPQGILLITTLIILQIDFALVLIPTFIITMDEAKKIKRKIFTSASHISADNNDPQPKTAVLLCALLLPLSAAIEGVLMPLIMRAFG